MLKELILTTIKHELPVLMNRIILNYASYIQYFAS